MIGQFPLTCSLMNLAIGKFLAKAFAKLLGFN